MDSLWNGRKGLRTRPPETQKGLGFLLEDLNNRAAR